MPQFFTDFSETIDSMDMSLDLSATEERQFFDQRDAIREALVLSGIKRIVWERRREDGSIKRVEFNTKKETEL